MARALALAERGGGATSPNPMVGCVIADDEGRVLGEGHHARAGEPHAEILALRAAGAGGHDVRGATAVVTLEPCAHHGRTPPCVDALVAAGIGRVVYATEDPHVGRGGAERLRAAGIEVEHGVEEAAARRLNEAWLHFVTTGRPFVHLKTALSLSGHITRGTPGERWITGPEARREVHRLRHLHRAVLVGIGTVLADDPLLTVRDWSPSGAGDGLLPETGPAPSQPIRVVLDSRLRLPPESRLAGSAAESPVWAFAADDAPAERESALRERGVDVIRAPAGDGRLRLRGVLDALAERDVTGVLAEPGPRLAGALLAAGVVGRWTIFLAPDWIEPRAARAFTGGPGTILRDVEWRSFGRDGMVTGRPSPFSPVGPQG